MNDFFMNLNFSSFNAFLEGGMSVCLEDDDPNRKCSRIRCLMQHNTLEECSLNKDSCPQFTPKFTNKEKAKFLRAIARMIEETEDTD